MLRLLLILALCFVCLPLNSATNFHQSVVSKHNLNSLYSASLFLSRAGFGGSISDIEAVANLGEKKWLKQQMSLLPSYHATLAIDRYNQYCESLKVSDCEKQEFLWRPLFRRFTLWDRVVNAPDQLGQKVAYALSQIFVISEAQDELENLEALSYWWDTLLQHGLGNYRDLLQAVTLSPAMGVYLSHYTNDKGDPSAGVFPDENYAREVMQLFSIGLFELNQDGSRKRDEQGGVIPSYNNSDIREFARVFTGLGNGCGDQQEFSIEVSAEFTCPMKVYEHHHDRNEKILLKGTVLKAGQDGLKDISDALDVLFLHPNTGPFFSRLLIQRLVKSNPTPEYIARVADKFNDNGEGIRGDLKAVVTQILTDPETKIHNEASGKVRDPFLRFAHLYKALNLTSKTGNYYSAGWFLDNNLKQLPLRAPSVFNFYSPNHMPFGEAGEKGLYSPEMQIISAFTTPMYYQDMQNQVMWTYQGEEENVDEDLVLDYADLLAVMPEPDALAEYLNIVFHHGEMTDVTRRAIRQIIEGLADDPGLAVRSSVYFSLIAPEYIVRP